MNSTFSDRDVLNLLTGLKNAESNYPSNMIQSRRDAYLKQAASMGVLLPTNQNGPSFTKPTPQAGKLLKIVTASAVTLGTVVTTYVYREEIRDFFNEVISPRVERVTDPIDSSIPPSLESPSIDEKAFTDTPSPTVTVTVTDTATATVTATSTEGVSPTPTTSTSNGSLENEQVNSTPNPNDNSGNHYGNTPKPDRTKEPQKNKNK